MTFSFKQLLKYFHRPPGQEKAVLPDNSPYQRSFDRFPIEFEVIASVVDSSGHQGSERSELHDVSGGGAMFISRMAERYFPGQHLKLDIFLAGTEDVRACIKTEASVVRIHQVDTDGLEKSDIKTGIAVEFHKPFEFERIDGSLIR